MVPNEAVVASKAGGGARSNVPSRSGAESPVGRLAQFFPDAVAMRLPVRITKLDSQRADAAKSVRSENTSIEYGTAEEVLFASSLALEFDDKVRLENVDGSLTAEASVVAVQYYEGRTAVAARFTCEIANWIIKR